MSEIADLLERFRRGAEIVATSTTGAAGAALDFRPTGENGQFKWSVRMIVCHLADAEVAAAMRVRQIVAEDNPTLQAWDQDLWAERLSYGKRKISDALETFRRVRADNYELLKDLPEDAFSRAGTHTGRGKITLLDLVQSIAQHPEGHARQIQTVREAYKVFRAQNAG